MYASVPALFVLFEEWAALRTTKLIWYVLLHAAAYLPVLAGIYRQIGPVDILTLAAFIVITGMGLHARLREVVFFRPKWPLFISGIVQFAVGYASGLTIALRTGQAAIAASAVLCIIWYNYASIEGTLAATHSKATVPYEQIRANNRFALLVSLGICAAVILPVVLLASGERIFDLIGKGLMVLLRAFVLLLSRIFGGSREENAAESSAESSYEMDLGAISDNDNPFLEIFWEALTFVIGAAVVILLIWLLWRFLKQFRKDFNGVRRMDGDRIEYLRPDEKKQAAQAEGRDHSFLSGRTPRMRIRRMYRKAIRSGAGAAAVRSSHTPREMEEAAFGADAESSPPENHGHPAQKGGTSDSGRPGRASSGYEPLRIIHGLYEKARYGAQESTTEEAALMKEQLRKI